MIPNHDERERERERESYIALGILRTKTERCVFLKTVCNMKNEKNSYKTIFFK